MAIATNRALVLFSLLTRILDFGLALHSFCGVLEAKKLKFYLLRECQRSTAIVCGLGNFENTFECAKMTHNSQGLAFNFSPLEKQNLLVNKSENGPLFPIKSARRHILEQPEEFYNCIALQCPENTNFTTLVNDSRFDYYSLYVNPIPATNSSCLPGVGIFQIYTNPVNYSSAFSTCITKSEGALAHVVSEARTHAISKFLEAFQGNNNTKIKLAYVGLNFSIGEEGVDFMTSEWECLKYFLYRAWAPGYPKENANHSCVAITKENSWVTTNCERKLPFICEVYTSAPSLNETKTNTNCPLAYN